MNSTRIEQHQQDSTMRSTTTTAATTSAGTTTTNEYSSLLIQQGSSDTSSLRSASTTTGATNTSSTSDNNNKNDNNDDIENSTSISTATTTRNNSLLRSLSPSSTSAMMMIPHKGTIGMLGSIAFAVNSLTGPAMLNLPHLYQKSGFIPTTVTLALLCILSTLCSLHLANVISAVPGNSNFHREIEYSDVFRHFWGQKAYIFTHITFFACITCLNIASIVDLAQVVDQILAKRLERGTMAFEIGFSHPNLHPKIEWNLLRWKSSDCMPLSVDNGDDNYDECAPFEGLTTNDTWIVTAGYLIAMVIFLPLSLKDLKETSTFQTIGFVVLIVLSFQFIATFLSRGIHFDNISLWGDDWSDLFGVCLFNLAAVIVVPSWLYEKKPSVSVKSALNRSSLIALLLYVAIGSLGAMSIHDVTDNMLQAMMSGKFGKTTEISSLIFAFFIIGLGIPLFSVLTRLNLTGSGLCSDFVANLLAVYLPWGVSWLFYSGGATTSLLGWGGIFFTSIIAFIAPLMLSLHVANSSSGGIVPVYGKLRLSSRQQEISLYGLLSFSCISIVLAVLGKVYATTDTIIDEVS